MTSTADAQGALEKLPRQWRELHPSAARSLAEGREDTLTVHCLPLPDLPRRTFATTNPIASAFSVLETVCRRLKRWRAGDHIERWVGSALWTAEGNFRPVRGCRDLPALWRALAERQPQSAAPPQAA